MILIIDYGMSNLRSVSKALQNLGGEAVVSENPSDLKGAAKVILPGVGAFGDAMKELDARGWVRPLLDFAASGKPLLGICLGLQLLFESSEENRTAKGLGIVKGDVVRFPAFLNLKVPHMGWNQLKFKQHDCPLTAGIRDGQYVYFVHSYFVRPADEGCVLAVTDYGLPFASMIWQGNVFGCQFHPEKSQEAGLSMIENFLRMGV
ncbi:MAG: imidazole glycerol phosphate synthase subunit HisH [Candidatus Omnitrophica bacterium]|nr:imidazole glycerol phosphate synthase subunit HisH [Candidatus Omnitrophota bacterium]